MSHLRAQSWRGLQSDFTFNAISLVMCRECAWRGQTQAGGPVRRQLQGRGVGVNKNGASGNTGRQSWDMFYKSLGFWHNPLFSAVVRSPNVATDGNSHPRTLLVCKNSTPTQPIYHPSGNSSLFMEDLGMWCWVLPPPSPSTILVTVSGWSIPSLDLRLHLPPLHFCSEHAFLWNLRISFTPTSKHQTTHFLPKASHFRSYPRMVHRPLEWELPGAVVKNVDPRPPLPHPSWFRITKYSEICIVNKVPRWCLGTVEFKNCCQPKPGITHHTCPSDPQSPLVLDCSAFTLPALPVFASFLSNTHLMVHHLNPLG